jgi:hypothetical protein
MCDVHAAACALGAKTADVDELEQARDWMVALLDASRPLEGHSLADRAACHDALLELKRMGQFTNLDALAVLKRPEDPWPRRPVCLLDNGGDMYLRAGEAATYVRHILGVRIRQSVLTHRWKEIGICRELVDDRRASPRLKGYFYRVPKGWTTQ